jgi:hypothetical protein
MFGIFGRNSQMKIDRLVSIIMILLDKQRIGGNRKFGSGTGVE